MSDPFINPNGPNRGGGSGSGSGNGGGGGNIGPGGFPGGPVGLVNADAYSLDDAKPYACGWYAQQRYYCCIGTTTWCYDFLSQAWTDTGYGTVVSARELTQPGRPEEFLLVAANGFSPDLGDAIVPNFGAVYMSAGLFSPLIAFDDVNNLYVPPQRSFLLRPMDGDGPARERRKRAKRLRIWGEAAYVPGGPLDGAGNTVLADVLLRFENGYTEVHRITAAATSGSDLLVHQEFLDSAVGRTPQVQVTWYNASYLKVRQIMLEYRPY